MEPVNVVVVLLVAVIAVVVVLALVVCGLGLEIKDLRVELNDVLIEYRKLLDLLEQKPNAEREKEKPDWMEEGMDNLLSYMPEAMGGIRHEDRAGGL